MWFRALPLLLLAPLPAEAAVTACRTPWEMHPGGGLQSWGYDMGSHGAIDEYQYASIPPVAGPGWTAAPDPQSVNYDLQGNSTLCGQLDCRFGAEFTYFKTLVYLPPTLSFDTATVTVELVDDGVRMTVFSASNPDGVTDPGGYAFLGGGSSSDLLPYMTSDPWSTIVITHADDCCSQALIQGVEVNVTVDGRPEDLSFDCDLEDSDGDGFPPAGGDCDDDDPEVHPGALELPNAVDDDCDEVVDEGTDWFDDDGDGFTEEHGDCDDGNPFAHPDAEELCDQDLQDVDCDGCPGAEDPDCGGTCGEAASDDDDSAEAVTPTLPEPAAPELPPASTSCSCSQQLDLQAWPLLLLGLLPTRRRRSAPGAP